VSVTRWSLMKIARAAKSMASAANFITGSPRAARSWRRIAEWARATTGDSVIRIQALKIDLAARNVFLEDERLTLTPKEYRLLQVLAQHSGNVVTHQYLLREVWGNEHIDDTHYLRIFVRKLRRKIEADPTQPRILLTELGVGYRLVSPDPAPAAAVTH
jgi:two-component system KDP operon response regulator KdpE